MRIAIDARLNAYRQGGIPQYTRQLLTALAEVAHDAQFLDIPIEEISVIYEAAAPLYGRLELRESEARVLNATPVAAGTFMLFVSTLEPRKNLPTLLHALRICLDRRPDADYQLVVVGRRGWRDDAIFAAVRDLQLGDHVLFAGGVGQYDLRWLYNA